MKTLIFPILFILTFQSFSQEYLVNDEKKIVFEEFENGIPEIYSDNFSNFAFKKNLGDSMSGLLKKAYLITTANRSTIEFEMENIGRLVLYAKIFNGNDSLLYNPFSKRNGSITIIPYRNNQPTENLVQKITFDEDIFHQIHINLAKAGINKMKIVFDSENDFFILEKLKIIPLNDLGIAYFQELEKSDTTILNLANNLEGNIQILKDNYKEQLNKAETYHINLSKLIEGNKFQNIASVRANSLNPFQDGKFISHYEEVLNHASDAEKIKIENLAKDIQKNDFANVAVTLDNLITGGKFSTLIGLVDNLFNFTIKIPEVGPVLNVNNNYYSQTIQSNGKIKLVPISNKSEIEQIENLTNKNKAFKEYTNQIVTFIRSDINTLNEINKDIALAKNIREELENLIWEIIQDDTSEKRENLINNNNIEFFTIGSEFEKYFDSEYLEMSTLLERRSKSIGIINKIDDLSKRYNKIVSSIKTHYDLLYEERPNARLNSFDHFAKVLPTDLLLNWKNSQNKILTEYKKPDGLQSFLSETTGREISSNEIDL